ncbi:hypothetical protein [Marinobacterium aestuariivivens]|uniref:Uncharacterized protein n=1 Tax=Marinobacterium aestuariivivens TaxID=1698799 RepID=A0ABW2A013_9GAMM
MKITLQRRLRVQRFPVLASVILRKSRPDIAELIRAAQQNPDAMPPRLMSYLRREGLWDTETKAITAAARQVLETGSVPARERGLYSIWYSDNDPLLGTRPLLLQRNTANWGPSWDKAKRHGDDSVLAVTAPATCFVHDGQAPQQLTLERLRPEVADAPEKSATLDLTWILVDQHSELLLQGDLELLGEAQKGKGQQRKNRVERISLRLQWSRMQVPALLEQIATAQDYSWDADAQRALCWVPEDFGQLCNFEVAEHELLRLQCPENGSFEKVLLEQYPLKPKGKQVADQWRMRWLEQQFAGAYTSPEDALRQQKAWLQQPAMAGFELQPLQGQELLNRLDRRRAPESYWHLAALQDLAPTRHKRHRSVLTYQKGQTFDLTEFVERLTHGHPVQYCVYADPHYKNRWQAGNLEWIQSQLQAQQGRVLTRAGELPRVPPRWDIETVSREDGGHDRFWVFVTDAGIHCWTCTTSLDFLIRDGHGNRVREVVTFAPIPEDQIPEFIEQAIDAMQGEPA